MYSSILKRVLIASQAENKLMTLAYFISSGVTLNQSILLVMNSSIHFWHYLLVSGSNNAT